MKKTSKSPLALRRETVRTLASSQLASAQGGGLTDYTDYLRDQLTDLINPQLPPGTLSGRNGGCGTVTTTTTSVINP
jgi:hypothetical protein